VVGVPITIIRVLCWFAQNSLEILKVASCQITDPINFAYLSRLEVRVTTTTPPRVMCGRGPPQHHLPLKLMTLFPYLVAQILDLSRNKISRETFEGLAVVLDNCEQLAELNVARELPPSACVHIAFA